MPYRDNKMTRIVHESLIESAFTTTLINIELDLAENLSTLRISKHIKKTKNKEGKVAREL